MTSTVSTKFLVTLIDPAPVVPVVVEAIYTRAFLHLGAQVTFLYQDYLQVHPQEEISEMVGESIMYQQLMQASMPHPHFYGRLYLSFY